jgi:CHAT domain-containing protein
VEVPAAETTEHIADFYGRWLGRGKDVQMATHYGAFRAAQLAALAQTRLKHGTGHPFYWAGVVYVGDPGDLPRKPAEAEERERKQNSADGRQME